jgi:hypothetical protein
MAWNTAGRNGKLVRVRAEEGVAGGAAVLLCDLQHVLGYVDSDVIGVRFKVGGGADAEAGAGGDVKNLLSRLRVEQAGGVFGLPAV